MPPAAAMRGHAIPTAASFTKSRRVCMVDLSTARRRTACRRPRRARAACRPPCRSRRVGRHLAQLRVPQRRAVRRIVGDEVARDVAGKEQPAGRRQQSGAETRGQVRPVPALPRDLAGLVVDGRQIAAARTDGALVLAAEPERAARIGFGQVVHRVGVGRRHVEQPGLRAERRRRPVGGALIGRRHERARDVVVLLRDAHRLPLGVQLRWPSSPTPRTCSSADARRSRDRRRRSSRCAPRSAPSCAARPPNAPSTSTGVCAESQSCVSCGEVW